MIFRKSLLRATVYIILFGMLASLVMIYSETKLQALLLLAIVFSLIGPISFRSMQGRLDLFEPLVIANCAFFFMFLCRPLSDLITGQTHHFGYTILTTFDKTLFLAWFGIICFQVGYFSPLGRRLEKLFPYPPKFKPGTAILLAWLFTALGATLFYLFINTQGGFKVVSYLLQGRQASNNELFLSSTGYLYNGIMMWGPASLIFFIVAVVCKRKHMFIPFAVLVLPLIFLYGSRGARSQLLPLVVSFPVFWYLWKRRRPSFKNLLLAGLIGLSLLGWIREVREIEAKDKMIDKLVMVLLSPLATISDLLTSPDTEMFDSMANELLVVPETLPFMHGATITDIFVRAVPRTLYPNKPLESNDEIVNALWSEHYSKSRASPCFSVIGVFYVDSGFISVALGMYFLGTIMSAFWLWFQANSNSVMSQMLYSMGLPFVVILMRGSIPDTLARMLFYFAPLFMLMVYKRLRTRIGRVIAIRVS